MIKLFTPSDIYNNRGCYNREQVDNLSFISKTEITIQDIANSEISLKDKFWFFRNKCDLNINQKRLLAIGCAKVVLSIYENKYPNDDRPRKAIEAAENRVNAAAAYADAYAAAAAAAADAYADAYAAAAAAYAADAADAYAYAAAAAYAADAAAAEKSTDETYTQKLQNFLLEFIENN